MTGSTPMEPDCRKVILDLLDVAKVALGPGSPPLSSAQQLTIITELLNVISFQMPAELMEQDLRVQTAEALCELLLQRDGAIRCGPPN